MTSIKVPRAPDLCEHALIFARLLAENSWLPDPDTVRTVTGAVFPTIRKSAKRGERIIEQGAVLGMYDDNTTPRWALLWAHGIGSSHPKGWSFAHVWPSSADISAYTCLANLVMVPECLQSLTDKNAPVTVFLKWHAWEVYGWKPAREDMPEKPVTYGEVAWRYFQKVPDPRANIDSCLARSRDKRAGTLRELMTLNVK